MRRRPPLPLAIDALNMPPMITSPQLVIKPQQLDPSNFVSFGHVIEVPLADTVNSIPTDIPTANPPLVLANQGTALKSSKISPWTDRYGQRGSRKEGQPTISLFSCFPRVLKKATEPESLSFCVQILERHPYTTQTFIPMGLAPSDTSTKYLVVVAPTLPPTAGLPDVGPPDLKNLRAFIAHGRQAVTYGAATWHAPMVVIGEKRVDFVVTQSTNGVPDDDCQEVGIKGEGLTVTIESDQRAGPRPTKL